MTGKRKGTFFSRFPKDEEERKEAVPISRLLDLARKDPAQKGRVVEVLVPLTKEYPLLAEKEGSPAWIPRALFEYLGRVLQGDEEDGSIPGEETLGKRSSSTHRAVIDLDTGLVLSLMSIGTFGEQRRPAPMTQKPDSLKNQNPSPPSPSSVKKEKEEARKGDPQQSHSASPEEKDLRPLPQTTAPPPKPESSGRVVGEDPTPEEWAGKPFLWSKTLFQKLQALEGRLEELETRVSPLLSSPSAPSGLDQRISSLEREVQEIKTLLSSPTWPHFESKSEEGKNKEDAGVLDNIKGEVGKLKQELSQAKTELGNLKAQVEERLESLKDLPQKVEALGKKAEEPTPTPPVHEEVTALMEEVRATKEQLEEVKEKTELLINFMWHDVVDGALKEVYLAIEALAAGKPLSPRNIPLLSDDAILLLETLASNVEKIIGGSAKVDRWWRRVLKS